MFAVDVACITAFVFEFTIGAVYTTGLEVVLFKVPPPETIDHVTPLPNEPVPFTEAVNVTVPPSVTVGLDDDTVTAVILPPVLTGAMVIVDVALLVASVTDVALITAVCCVVTAGATYVAVVVPVVSVPPPETICHTTAVEKPPVP